MASEPLPRVTPAQALAAAAEAEALEAIQDRALARQRVHRFSATERWLHAVNATAFLLMLASGLALYLPFLAQTFGNRPVVKAVHLAVAALWLTGLLLVNVLGDRRILHRTRLQFESLDRQDLKWLYRQAARRQPAGRFNGGQKFNAVIQGALTVLFFVSGTLLWLGERNTDFRLPGTIALHDVSMFVAGAFTVGHIMIAISPTAKPSLSGLVDGTVPASYAAEHHAAWIPEDEPLERRPPLTPLRVAAASVILAAGALAAALLAGAG